MSENKDDLNIWGNCNIGFGNSTPAIEDGQFNMLSNGTEPMATFRRTNTGNADLDSLIRYGYAYPNSGNNAPYIALTNGDDAPLIAFEQIGTGTLANPQTGIAFTSLNNAGSFILVQRNNFINTFPLIVDADGTITAGTTPNYANLITADNDIPNKAYVDNNPRQNTWSWDGNINSSNITTSQSLRRQNGTSISNDPYGAPFAYEIWAAFGSNRRDINVSWIFRITINGNTVLNVTVQNGEGGFELNNPIVVNAFDDIDLRIESPAGRVYYPGGTIWCRRI